jgi:hypothetical protein
MQSNVRSRPRPGVFAAPEQRWFQWARRDPGPMRLCRDPLGRRDCRRTSASFRHVMPTIYDPRHYLPVPTCHPGLRVRIRLPPPVTEVLSVDSSTAVPPRLSRTRFRSSSDMQRSEAAVQEMGTVKWYKANDQRVSFTAKEAAAVANRVTASVSTACGRRSVGMAKVEQNACSAYGETAK